MGIFSKGYSSIKKIDGEKCLVKFNDIDLKRGGLYVVSKDIDYIYNEAFKNSRIQNVTIKNCTAIGEGAFKGCKNLKTISLSTGIKIIGEKAFDECAEIEEIVIPEGVTEILPGTFANCKKLKRVVLPSTLKKIGENAFLGCQQLNDIVLPESLQTIEKGAFAYCLALEELKIPKNVKNIDYAFRGCQSLKNVEINAEIEVVGDWFSGCTELQSLRLPNSAKEIINGAFYNCSKLININFPSGLEKIGSDAFRACSSLSEIVLPSSINTIGAGAFALCDSLKKINIPSNIKSIQSSTFYGCAALENVQLNEGLQSIEENAFGHCKNLVDIILPNSLLHLKKSAFVNSGIKSITIPENVKYIDGAFYGCESLENVYFNSNSKIESLGELCFDHNKSLKNVTLPNYLKVIDKWAFDGSAIETIIIPDGVETINQGAFSGCTELCYVKLSSELKTIKESAFMNCENLQEVIFPEGTQQIGDSAFYSCSSLKKIIIPSSVYDVGDEAFANCVSLESVVIPKNVGVVSSGCFMSCINLKDIKIEDGIIQVNSSAFSYTPIKEIEFPASVFNIESCLNGCYDLEKITINGRARIDKNLFNSCINLKVINIPQGLCYYNFDLSLCKKLEEINYRGKKIPVTDAILNNFSNIIPFLDYSIDNNKFLPKSMFVLTRTKPEEISNFYMYSKEWNTVFKTYLEKLGNSELGKSLSDDQQLYKQVLTSASEGLYQACIMLGLFQDGKNGKEAKEFIMNEIINLEPSDIHQLFGSLNTRTVGYNEEFAKFFIKNYERPCEANGYTYFMHKEITELSNAFDDQVNSYVKNYIPFAYSNWDKVKLAFPNKTVIAHREQGSDNNNLTFEDIVKAIDIVMYENVNEGNQELANLVGRYGHTQEDFEILQNLFEHGKAVKNDMILSIKEDTAEDGIKYSLLSKDDPKGIIIGTLTNCCQELNNVGESCMRYGVTAVNSGFIEFTYNEQTVGQSWVWYNEKTKEICLDNIEIPTVWQKQISSEKGSKSFIDCLTRVAVGFKQQMQQNGYEVKKVTIGAGYNDLKAIRAFEKIHTDTSVLPDDYSGYSDATSVQYIIPEKTSELLK